MTSVRLGKPAEGRHDTVRHGISAGIGAHAGVGQHCPQSLRR